MKDNIAVQYLSPLNVSCMETPLFPKPTFILFFKNFIYGCAGSFIAAGGHSVVVESGGLL